jgi:gamma-glutamylcyclotransferase (GGCT)/AIG2-like uncharacterized protein YtfP
LNPPLYFAYGSNLDALQMRARCPGAAPLQRARLGGHRLSFTHYSTRWSGGAADVVPDASAAVWGLVYAMGPDDFARLDPFESGYGRVELEVELGGRAVRVTSYAVREREQFPPHPVYLEKMLRWGSRWRLPGDYLAELLARAAALRAASPTPGPSRPR